MILISLRSEIFMSPVIKITEYRLSFIEIVFSSLARVIPFIANLIIIKSIISKL